MLHGFNKTKQMKHRKLYASRTVAEWRMILHYSDPNKKITRLIDSTEVLIR